MRKKVRELSKEKLTEYVRVAFRAQYTQEARPLQIASVVSLALGITTFLLAGTGYGKTRIAKAFIKLFAATSKAIILIICPLDDLGDNQVSKGLDLDVDD